MRGNKNDLSSYPTSNSTYSACDSPTLEEKQNELSRFFGSKKELKFAKRNPFNTPQKYEEDLEETPGSSKKGVRYPMTPIEQLWRVPSVAADSNIAENDEENPNFSPHLWETESKTLRNRSTSGENDWDSFSYLYPPRKISRNSVSKHVIRMHNFRANKMTLETAIEQSLKKRELHMKFGGQNELKKYNTLIFNRIFRDRSAKNPKQPL